MLSLVTAVVLLPQQQMIIAHTSSMENGIMEHQIHPFFDFLDHEEPGANHFGTMIKQKIHPYLDLHDHEELGANHFGMIEQKIHPFFDVHDHEEPGANRFGTPKDGEAPQKDFTEQAIMASSIKNRFSLNNNTDWFSSTRVQCRRFLLYNLRRFTEARSSVWIGVVVWTREQTVTTARQ
jgi:hypothetical protein